MVHGCMVYTERAEMAAVSCDTGHASAVSTPLRWMLEKKEKKKTRYKNLVTHAESHAERSESARERRIALYKSDQQQQQQLRLYHCC